MICSALLSWQNWRINFSIASLWKFYWKAWYGWNIMENFALIEKIVPQIYAFASFSMRTHIMHIIQNILFAFTALSLLYEGFQSESRDFKSDVGILRPQRWWNRIEFSSKARWVVRRIQRTFLHTRERQARKAFSGRLRLACSWQERRRQRVWVKERDIHVGVFALWNLCLMKETESKIKLKCKVCVCNGILKLLMRQLFYNRLYLNPFWT